MTVLSVERGEEPQQAETSKTRALTLSRPLPSREHDRTSPARPEPAAEARTIRAMLCQESDAELSPIGSSSRALLR